MNRQELANQAVLNLGEKNSYTHQLEWGMTPEGIVNWLGLCKEDHPTQEEINAEIKVLQAEFDSQEYARKREAEYPSIQECVHAILDDDLTALQEKRQAIKSKYPKS